MSRLGRAQPFKPQFRPPPVIGSTFMRAPIFGVTNVATVSNSTVYYTFCFGRSAFQTTTLATNRTPIAVAGTISGLQVSLFTAPGGSDSYAVTLMKNGSATALTTTISASATTGNDITHAVTVAAGDTLAWQVVGSATAAASNLTLSAIFTSTVGNETFISTNAPAPMSATATQYYPLMGNSLSTTEATVSVPMPTAGTLDKFYIDFNASPGAGTSYMFTLYKNGNPTSLTATVSGTNTTSNDLVDSVAVVAGDVLSIQSVPTSTPSTRYGHLSMRFVPTIPGEHPMFNLTTTGWTNSATRYGTLQGKDDTSSTETVEALSPMSFTLKKMYALVDTAPGTGKSWTIVSRKNFNTGNLTATFSNAGVSSQDTTNFDNVLLGDLLNWSHTPSGTPSANFKATITAVAYNPIVSTGNNAWVTTLTEAITNSDTFLRIWTIGRSFTEAITNTDALLKTAGRLLSEAITNTDTFLRTITRVLTEAITNTDTLIRTLSRALIEAITNTDVFTGNKVRSLPLSDSITNTDSLTRTIGRTLSEAITNTDTFLRTLARTLTEAITNSDTFSSFRIRVGLFTESITHTDVFSRVWTIGRSFTEAITHTDFFSGLLNGDIWTHVSKSTAAAWSHTSHSAAATWSHISQSVSTWTHKGKS